MEEDKGFMKNNKRCTLGKGKKFAIAAAAVLAIAAVGVGLFFGLSSNDTPTQPVTPPPIEQPVDPNPGTDNPGIENPGEENPGEENPGEENPGEENPGTENPGEENPGIDDPEEDPSEEEELLPPASIRDIFPSADADEETLNKAKIYQTQIINSLNDNLRAILASRLNVDVNNLSQITWGLSANTENPQITEKIYARFVCQPSTTSHTEYAYSIKPGIDLSFADIYNGDPTVLSEAFKTQFIGGARYTTELSFSYNPSIQESSADLTAVLINQAFEDGDLNISDFGISISQNQNGDLEVVADPDTSVFIVDNGYRLDATLGAEARQIILFIKNDNGYQKLTYSIGNPEYDITKLIEELNVGKYRLFTSEKSEFAGQELNQYDLSQVLPYSFEVAGSTVTLNLFDYLLNEQE